VAVGATDMRKGFDGLYGLARDKLGLEVRSGHLFLFVNSRRNRLKILYLGWERAVDLRQTPGKRKIQLAAAWGSIGAGDVES
jgi:hypothetical protein